MRHTLEAFRLACEKPPGYLKLHKFCERVEDGKFPDEELLKDIAKAFRALIDAKTLEKGQSAFADSLKLKQESKEGRPPSTATAERQFTAAYLYAYYRLKMNDRVKALEQAAKESHYDGRSVEKYYSQNRKKADSLARQILQFESAAEFALKFLSQTEE